MSQARHVFLIGMRPGADAVQRVLDPFVLQEGELTGLSLTRDQEGPALRVEVQGLCERGAERVGRRLKSLAVVRSLGIGWVA